YPRRAWTEITKEEWDQVLGTNLTGYFLCARAVFPYLKAGGNGRIVNISSINTVHPAPGVGLYAASKGALEQLTAVAATELGLRGITVNTVSPGVTDTDMQRNAPGNPDLAELAELSPLGRIGTPADIADVVAFLVGEDGRWMTGQNLRAGGGIV
ncbi:MAG TPA: SDR family oxidoreductase, partial [Solirubrobacterales bacterium]|nr:SDR family oxidoreductase [Solirubrobacterales bacterium]